MSNSEFIEIEMQMHIRTQKAILVSDDGKRGQCGVAAGVADPDPRQGRRQDDRHHAGVAGHAGGVDLMPIVIGARSVNFWRDIDVICRRHLVQPSPHVCRTFCPP